MSGCVPIQIRMYGMELENFLSQWTMHMPPDMEKDPTGKACKEAYVKVKEPLVLPEDRMEFQYLTPQMTRRSQRTGRKSLALAEAGTKKRWHVYRYMHPEPGTAFLHIRTGRLARPARQSSTGQTVRSPTNTLHQIQIMSSTLLCCRTSSASRALQIIVQLPASGLHPTGRLTQAAAGTLKAC